MCVRLRVSAATTSARLNVVPLLPRFLAARQQEEAPRHNGVKSSAGTPIEGFVPFRRCRLARVGC